MSISKETREALRKEVQDMLDQSIKDIMEDGGRLDRLFKSGAVDVTDFESGKRPLALPKNIVCAIGRQIEADWVAHFNKDEQEIENLFRFL